MARIKSIRVGATTAVVHPTEVDCEIRKVTAPGEGVLLQLSTFGSSQRKSQPKVSQTIQMDRDTALRLRELIDHTFGLD